MVTNENADRDQSAHQHYTYRPAASLDWLPGVVGCEMCIQMADDRATSPAAAAEIARLRSENIRFTEGAAERLHRTVERLKAAESKVARVEALHVKVFTSVSDEVYGNNPTCACGHHWPCETRAALDGAE